MRPEAVSELRSRMAGKARHLLAEAMTADALRVSAKNGAAKTWPTAETVATNRDLKAAWDAAESAHRIEVVGDFVQTGIGVEIYRVTEVLFPDAQSVASFLGQEWPRKTAEICGLTEDVPKLRAPELLRALLCLSSSDLKILRALCSWRADRTTDEMSDLMLREISVPNMSTKWMEQNAAIVMSVFEKAGWTVTGSGTLAERLGLEDPDRSEIRVRVHPDDARAHGIWPRFGVPSTEFATFPFSPSSVLIVENKTTFLRVKAEPGAVIIWGSGKAIVAWAKRMKWLHEVPEQVYWGDCDGAGYLILDRLRGVLPMVQSFNMTLTQILPNIEKAVRESGSEAVTADMPNLTRAENDARRYMHNSHLRLEQEFMTRD